MPYEIQLNARIDDVLNVWVRRWASEKGCKGYPSLQSFMRESANQVTRFSINELDERTYVRIDEAVKVLHDRNFDAYQVLMAVFLQRQERKVICETIGISPKTYHERLNAAKSFMEGSIFGSGLVKVRL
ncbi:antitermination protein [Pasteurellaceae bacterium Orientalotternb1]|nr:antitermination protein [Pasteurellaceae bacterium Orientalotternb1]